MLDQRCDFAAKVRNMRRHGWHRPLHSLQIVGIAIFSFLVVAFYAFLGLFLGNKNLEIAITSVFSVVAVSVRYFFVRCTVIDPTDKTSFKKKRKVKTRGFAKLNYGFIFSQILVRFFRRLERKILKHCIRRKYLDPLSTNVQIEPLLPFLLDMKDNALTPYLKDVDITFCSYCDFEVSYANFSCSVFANLNIRIVVGIRKNVVNLDTDPLIRPNRITVSPQISDTSQN